MLINCAGVIIPQRHTSVDGYELNFAVHHLAPFAITSRLLPLLLAGGVPAGPQGRPLARVVNVNSAGHQASLGGHHNPTLDFDDLQSERSYDPFLAYSRSKLANLLFTYELDSDGREYCSESQTPSGVRRSVKPAIASTASPSDGPYVILRPVVPSTARRRGGPSVGRHASPSRPRAVRMPASPRPGGIRRRSST